MKMRFLLPIAALGLVLGGCCHHRNTTVAQPASTSSRNNRYELASRVFDPLANDGAGTSAGIPDDPTIGNYPGPITPPVTPLMAFGD